MLLQFLLVFHVMGAMLWFGGSMSMPRRARTALECELSSARVQLRALAREGRMLALAGLVTFVTGVSLVFTRGGFAGLPVRYHVSLLLSLIWIVIGAVLVRRTVEGLVAASEGETLAEGTDAGVRRLAMLTGIQHALFSTVTVLMLWRLG